MIKEYDINTYYEDLYRDYNDYRDLDISELAEQIACAIQRRTGEKIKDWTYQFKIIGEISENIYDNMYGIEDLQLEKYDISGINPNLDAIQLEETIWKVLDEWQGYVSKV